MTFRSLNICFLLWVAPLTAAEYFPPPGEWERRKPEQLQIDPTRLQQAVDFFRTNENPATKDLGAFLRQTYTNREPNYKLLGPTQPRAAGNGLIVYRGYIVAEWGDTERVDMANSLTKTFLTTVVGVAWQRGLIRDLNHRAGDYLPTAERTELFGSEHNAKITWDHLLRQTSDWSGTLWGVPDWADAPVGATPADYPNRPRHEPGAFFTYNDVRVNLMAFVALQVWRRPLPEVLRGEIMTPIGASNTWRWHGYENSWVVIDGARMQSVSGGGHFGGGMFINAHDLARFGYLFLRHGRWGGRQLVSEEWIRMARTPGPDNPTYGFANWYLNPGRRALPNGPEDSVIFHGSGPNIIYVDWENDLMIVARWIRNDETFNQFLGLVMTALTEQK